MKIPVGGDGEVWMLLLIGKAVWEGVLECEGEDGRRSGQVLEKVQKWLKGRLSETGEKAAQSQAEEVLNHYVEDRFWEELEVRLGEKEWRRLSEMGRVEPQQLEELVEKYADEFAENGLERLEISGNLSLEPAGRLGGKITIRD